MSGQAFYSTVQLRQAWDEELAAEIEAKRVERANEILAEMRDAEFIDQLEAKYPGLKGWTK